MNDPEETELLRRMIDRVRRFSIENRLLSEGDRVLVALSGGADSVCLLLILRELAPELHLSLRALHLHHGLRGAEADRDAEFSRALCENWEIPFTLVYRDVSGYAAEHSCSCEEAGRLLRYAALEEAAAAWEHEIAVQAEEAAAKPHVNLPAPTVECGTVREAPVGAFGIPERMPPDGGRAFKVKIAVAHHADDNAETILHHLLRGSGLRGLAGMRAVQGRRIRPLLCVRRDEIRTFLTERGQGWCEDSTNSEMDYTRNRIRNQVLPLLTETVNARAAENILHAGELFGQADAYLERQAEQLLENREGSGASVLLSVFLAQPPILRSYVVRVMLDRAAPGQKDLTARHFALIAGLAERQVGAGCDLPGNLRAWRDYTSLHVGRMTESLHAPAACCTASHEHPAGALGIPEYVPPDGGGIFVESSSLPAEQMENGLIFDIFFLLKGMEIPKKQYTKWFDYDKIKNMLSVRTRESGDYITLSGGGRKTVKRFMIDEKIPRAERDHILLLAEGSHVLWIVGWRISEYYKVTAQTVRVLQVSLHAPAAG